MVTAYLASPGSIVLKHSIEISLVSGLPTDVVAHVTVSAMFIPPRVVTNLFQLTASLIKEFLSDKLGFVFDEKEAGFQFVFDRIDTVV